jgi:hypothetical protein
MRFFWSSSMPPACMDRSGAALEPEAGVARPLVKLDLRHAPLPLVCSRHAVLHSAQAPTTAKGELVQYRARASTDVGAVSHSCDLIGASRRADILSSDPLMRFGDGGAQHCHGALDRR